MTIRRWRLFALVMFLVVPTAFAKGSGKRIIDLATHQEILLYSIVADYAMAGMGVDYHDPKGNITKEIKSYETNLVELKQLAPDLFASGKTDAMEEHWKVIKGILALTIDQRSMLKLYAEAKLIEKQFEVIAEHQAEIDHDSNENLILLTGELGMESQRMAALYMIETWDVSVKSEVDKEIHLVFKEIETIFARITDLHASDPRAVELVEKLEKDVLVLEHLVESERSYPVLVAKATEKIVSEVEELMVYIGGFISFRYAHNLPIHINI